MGKIKVEYNIGNIKGLCTITPALFEDNRGYFTETYNQQDMAEAGLNYHFVQENQSRSSKGVLRGLHFQKQYPQAKLVRVIKGAVYDVALDIRTDSKTFGKHYGIILSENNHKQLLIPKGFAHGFIVISDYAEFCYKCDNFWHSDDQYGILYSDPEINIKWPKTGNPLIVADKDSKWPLFKEAIKS